MQRTSQKGLIIIGIVSAVDYHVTMWQLCDNHLMIIINQLPICNWSTNKKRNQTIKQTDKQTDKPTNNFEYDDYLIIVQLS